MGYYGTLWDRGRGFQDLGGFKVLDALRMDFRLLIAGFNQSKGGSRDTSHQPNKMGT